MIYIVFTSAMEPPECLLKIAGSPIWFVSQARSNADAPSESVIVEMRVSKREAINAGSRPVSLMGSPSGGKIEAMEATIMASHTFPKTPIHMAQGSGRFVQSPACICETATFSGAEMAGGIQLGTWLVVPVD